MENSNPIEHQNVPPAHQGLHDFLYSSTDEHSATVATVPEQTFETLLDINAWCSEAENAKVAGVYAVLNCDRQTQYIGYSRNVVLSLRSHLTQMGEKTCTFAKVQPFKFPKRDAMEQLRDQWISALPSLPPGNVSGSWAETVKDAAVQVMSSAEREDYEEKKLKLRHAMADNTLSRGLEVGELEQGQALASAMTDDNWSAVIHEQTQETQAL
jgi:hypothetical protein